MSQLRRPLFPILVILIALGAIEGLAWWWMNPASTHTGEPVLAFRREVNAEKLKTEMLKEEAPGQSSSPNPQSTILNPQSEISSSSTDHRSLLTDHSSTFAESQDFSVSAFQLLPDIYRQAAPMLRCSSGQVFHIQIHDTAGLHGAFFEWDGTDTGSVLEAFRHMPEACMGAIGMKLVSKEKPIVYTVRSKESEIRGQEEKSASSSNQKSRFKNQDSKISSSSPNLASPISNLHLIFDHTVFRDPGQSGGPLGPGPLVHAFRAVWVSGVSSADARQGLDGREFNQLRAIRFQSALTRFRPAHARVIQGTVRGLYTPEAAWQAFEQHMLCHLTFEP